MNPKGFSQASTSGLATNQSQQFYNQNLHHNNNTSTIQRNHQQQQQFAATIRQTPHLQNFAPRTPDDVQMMNDVPL